MPSETPAGTPANPIPTLVALGLGLVGATLIATSLLWWSTLAHPGYSLLGGLTTIFVALTIPLVRNRH